MCTPLINMRAYLHVEFLSSSQPDMLEHCTRALCKQLPWHQVAVMLCNR